MTRTTLLLLILALAPFVAAADVNGDRAETILLPLAFAYTNNVPGAYGTMWSGEVWLENRTTEPVSLWTCTFVCPRIGAGERLLLGFPLGRHPEFGFLWTMAADVAPHLTFSNRIFERTLRAQPRGVDIPVVREGSFFNGEQTFLGVPAGEGVRVSLRAYNPWNHVPTPTVNLQRLLVTVVNDAGAELGRFEMRPEILNPTTSGEDWFKPGIAAVHDLAAVVPAMRAHQRVHIKIGAQPGQAQYYAMVAVTDNETQTLSIITAQ